MNGSDGETPVVVTLSCGSSHTVALLSCDIVASWGRGEDGQLGHGDADEKPVPTAVHALLNGKTDIICCGAEYTVAISKSRKEVYSWGWGDFGRLGHGNSNDVFVPVPIQFFSGKVITSVACGDTHTMAITEAGELFSFGRNGNGQLGLGHTTDVLEPRRVEAFQGRPVASVACGAEHTVCATADGQCFGWGWGRYGNLGDGECQDRWTPTQVQGLVDVKAVAVACGWRHSAALSDEGHTFTFGWSKYGQLGHGDFNDRLVATEVEALKGKRITLIAGGWRHTMAADDEGNLYAWGWNKFGQLGVGDSEDRNGPTVVSALQGKKIALLACGWRHTACSTSDGEVFTWGRGVNGQLGHGNLQDRSSPVQLHRLCKGTLKTADIAATASAASGYVKAADRYALVPDSMAPDAGTGGVKRPRTADDQSVSKRQHEEFAVPNM